MKKNCLLIGCLFMLTGMQINAQTKTNLNDIPAFNCDYSASNGLDTSAKADRTAPTTKLIGYLELNGQQCDIDQGTTRKNIYIDKTATVIKVKRGATYSLKMNNKGFSWMHTSLWIDYDQNKAFNKDAGYTVDSSSELVSFDYFSTNAESNTVRGVNSRGTQFSTDDARAGQQGVINDIFTLPQFTIPADATLGQTRMRFTCNWGSIDPSGLLPANSVGSAKNSPGSVNATIVDVTLEIEENTSTVIFEQPAIGGTFTIKQDGNTISSNDKFTAGTEFTVETMPDLGYHVLAIKVNGTAISGNTFTLGSADTTVTVEYIADTAGIFTFSASANGSMTVETSINGVLSPITSGSIVEQGTQIKVTVTPNNNYLLNTVMLNGEDKTSMLNNGVLMFDFPNYNVEITASFKKDPNIIEYCTPNINRNYADRYFTSLTIAGATSNSEVQDFSSTLFSNSNRQTKVYVNRLSEKLKATSGDELTVSFIKGGSSFEWTHFYVYVDYNHDGEFDTEKELVSYTYLNKSHEFDSKGTAREASYCPNACPSFIIPNDITPGETRIRIKADWSSSDPCGDTNIGTTRGSIIDYTIDIQKAIFNVTFEQPENGYGTFKIKNGDTEISSGDEIDLNTVLTVEALPLSNEYEVKAILVNGEAITGNTITVKNNIEISVEFIKGRLITYTVNEGGTLSVKNGETAIENNSAVNLGTTLQLALTTNTGYELSSFIINNVDMTNEVKEGGIYTISSVTTNVDIQVTFTKLNYKFSYSFNELGTVDIKESGVTVENDQMIPYNTSLHIDITPNTQCNVKSIMLDGVEKKDELLANGNSFSLIITKETTLTVEFEATKYSLNCNTPQYGTMEITNNDGDVFSNESEVPYSGLLYITLTPASDNTLTNLIVDDGTGAFDYMEEEGLVEETDGKYTTQVQVLGNVTITAAFSIPTGINNTNIENSVIYFNKAGSLIVENAEIGSMIEIYNVTGQVIKKQGVTSSKEVINDMSTSNAVYLIKISNGTEFVTKKVVR